MTQFNLQYIRKKYACPEIRVERFDPQEFCSACEWSMGDELITECSNTKVVVTGMNGTTPNQGQVGSSSGVIYMDPLTGELVFSGHINEGHTTHQEGEYYSIYSAGQGYSIGDTWSGGQKLCGHNVPGAHHHICRYNKKNPS